MPKYIDLLEQRTTLKAKKEQMFKLGYQQTDLDKIDYQINRLSIEIRSLEPDDSPTIILDDVPASAIKPKLLPISYEDFVELYKENIITSITEQLNEVDVPIGVYAIFKNTVVKSENYIMKHHYNIYCREVEAKNNE